MGALFELEDQGTDLEVFGAAGVKGEGRSRCSGGDILVVFSTSEQHPCGQQRAPLARVVLQQLSQNTLTGSPPLSGEEPTLVCLTKSFLL